MPGQLTSWCSLPASPCLMALEAETRMLFRRSNRGRSDTSFALLRMFFISHWLSAAFCSAGQATVMPLQHDMPSSEPCLARARQTTVECRLAALVAAWGGKSHAAARPHISQGGCLRKGSHPQEAVLQQGGSPWAVDRLLLQAQRYELCQVLHTISQGIRHSSIMHAGVNSSLGEGWTAAVLKVTQLKNWSWMLTGNCAGGCKH